jgi:hypothetical protein
VILAPTDAALDAALGAAVVTIPVVPVRVRRALNVESGLNDRIVTPFVTLFLALLVQEEGPGTRPLAGRGPRGDRLGASARFVPWSPVLSPGCDAGPLRTLRRAAARCLPSRLAGDGLVGPTTRPRAQPGLARGHEVNHYPQRIKQHDTVISAVRTLRGRSGTRHPLLNGRLRLPCVAGTLSRRRVNHLD